MKDTTQGHKHGKKPRVGAGLPLDKFANAKVSKYNKREVLQKQHLQRLNKLHKLKKIKHRMEGQGRLTGTLNVKDNIEDLEQELRGQPVVKQPPPGLARKPKGKPPKHAPPAEDSEEEDKDMTHAPDDGKEGSAGDMSESGSEHEVMSDEEEEEDVEEPTSSGRHIVPQQRPGEHQQPKHQQQQQQQHGGRDKPDRKHQHEHQPRHQQHQQQGRTQQQQGEDKQGQQEQGNTGRPHHHKPLSRLQRIAIEVDAKKAEEQAVKEERMKAAAERKTKIEAVEKARKKEKHNYFKRNSKGQPLMRYRMEKILEQLQRS